MSEHQDANAFCGIISKLAQIYSVPSDEVSKMTQDIRNTLPENTEPKQHKQAYYSGPVNVEHNPHKGLISADKSGVPLEYQDDPDLWHAMQVSMNDCPQSATIKHNDSREEKKTQSTCKKQLLTLLGDEFEVKMNGWDGIENPRNILDQTVTNNNQRSKQEYLAELRDKKAVKFQQKRIYAQKIVKGPRIAISGLKQFSQLQLTLDKLMVSDGLSIVSSRFVSKKRSYTNDVDSQCKTEGDDEENLYGGPNEDAAML